MSRSLRVRTIGLLLWALTLGTATAEVPANSKDAGANARPSPASTEPVQAAKSDSQKADASERAPSESGEKLRAVEDELAAVMDELVRARARASVLSQALFRSRLTVELIRRGNDAELQRVVLSLDGVPIHDSDGAAVGRDPAKLFEGFVAPGMHELGVELHERENENGEFGYVRQERYRIDVKAKRRTRVELIVDHESDMAEEASEGDDGSYELATELRVLYGKANE